VQRGLPAEGSQKMSLIDDTSLRHTYALNKEYSPDQKGLTESYTLEERKGLHTSLLQELYERFSKNYVSFQSKPQYIDVATDDCWSSPIEANTYQKEIEEKKYPINKHLFGPSYFLFEAPLEDMPTYLNDESYKNRAIAKWRLNIGR